MARKSKEEKQQGRAREDLAAALARADAELGVVSLLRLPPQEREADLPRVARLFQGAVASDHRRGDWSRLAFWSARAEREPRLLLQDRAAAEDGVQGASETRWALLWACARSGQWDRARRHATALSGRLPACLQGAVDAYVAASGAPAPDAYRELIPAPPAEPRLGYDRGQREVVAALVPRAPARPEDVEPAVLACASLRPSGDFASTIDQWAAASPELAPAIFALAAHLRRGEILARLCEGASALEPARSLAVLLGRLGQPEALPEELRRTLEDDALLSLRVAAALVRRPGALDRDDASALATILRAAAAFPRLRRSAFALTLTCSFLAESRTIALGLLESLCRLPEAGPLWLMALVLSETDFGAEVPAPRWIAAGVDDLLRRPDEFASSLAQLADGKRRAVLESAPQVLPLAVAERLLDQAWAVPDHALKPALLAGLEEILRRASQSAGAGVPASTIERVMAGMAEGMGFAPSREEIRQMLATPEGRRIARELESEFGREPGRSGGGPLTPVARRIWDRFAERAIPFSVSYLQLAIEQDGRKPERTRAVERFLGEKVRDGKAVIAAIQSAEREGYRLASKALMEHVLGTLGNDRQGLAEALLEASRRRLRKSIRGALARAFKSADASAMADGRQPDAASPEVLSARLEARLATVPRRGVPIPPAVPRKRPRGPGPKAQQQPLPFSGRQR